MFFGKTIPSGNLNRERQEDVTNTPYLGIIQSATKLSSNLLVVVSLTVLVSQTVFLPGNQREQNNAMCY